MDVKKQNDESILLVSDGSPEENEAINILSELLLELGRTEFLAESQANAFGTGSDDGGKTYKNYVYLPWLGEKLSLLPKD